MAGKREFGKWQAEFAHPQLGDAPKWDAAVAMIWAARSRDEFEQAAESEGCAKGAGLSVCYPVCCPKHKISKGASKLAP